MYNYLIIVLLCITTILVASRVWVPRRHQEYLKYVIKHKWFVVLASFEVGLPLWRALLHDWTKFMPSEWNAYVNKFFYKDGSPRGCTKHSSGAFKRAWVSHQKRNKHHWQAWVDIAYEGKLTPLLMDEVYIREMIADWIGAGRAISGKRDFKEFYEKNKDRMILHSGTEAMIENIITKLKD